MLSCWITGIPSTPWRIAFQEFMVFSDTTTSLSPASMETVDAGGLRGGYPAWIINEMIKLDIDPEAHLPSNFIHII